MMIIWPMSYILLISPDVYLKSRVLDLSPVFMKHWQLAKMINSHWVGSGIPRLAVARLEDPFFSCLSFYTLPLFDSASFPTLPSLLWIMMIILPMSYILLIGPGVCLKESSM